MLNNMRWKIGTLLMKKAANLCETGDFNNLIKGLKIVNLAVRIAPPSKELTDFKRALADLVEKYS